MKTNIFILFILSITLYACKPKSDVSNSTSGKDTKVSCGMNYTADITIVSIEKANRGTSSHFSYYPYTAMVKIDKIIKNGTVTSEEMNENAVVKVNFVDFERAFTSDNPLKVNDKVKVCLEYHVSQGYNDVSWFINDFKKIE